MRFFLFFVFPSIFILSAKTCVANQRQESEKPEKQNRCRKAADQKGKTNSNMASTYGTQDWHQHLERTVSAALLARHSWLGLSEAKTKTETKTGTESKPEANVTSAPGTIRLLDYACGPGMVTRTLAPYVDVAVGMDVSERMVERYRELAGSLDLQKLEGIVGNLVDGEAAEEKEKEEHDSAKVNGDSSSVKEELRNFDIAVVGLGFHHFDDPVRAAKALASRLRDEGGVLLIIDFVGGCGSRADREKAERQEQQQRQQRQEQKQKKTRDLENEGEENEADLDSLIPEAMHDTVRVHGFDREGVEEIFTSAGLKNFEWDEIEEEVKLIVDGQTKRRKVFLAKGVKH